VQSPSASRAPAIGRPFSCHARVAGSRRPPPDRRPPRLATLPGSSRAKVRMRLLTSLTPRYARPPPDAASPPPPPLTPPPPARAPPPPRPPRGGVARFVLPSHCLAPPLLLPFPPLPPRGGCSFCGGPPPRLSWSRRSEPPPTFTLRWSTTISIVACSVWKRSG